MRSAAIQLSSLLACLPQDVIPDEAFRRLRGALFFGPAFRVTRNKREAWRLCCASCCPMPQLHLLHMALACHAYLTEMCSATLVFNTSSPCLTSLTPPSPSSAPSAVPRQPGRGAGRRGAGGAPDGGQVQAVAATQPLHAGQERALRGAGGRAHAGGRGGEGFRKLLGRSLTYMPPTEGPEMQPELWHCAAALLGW